MVQTGKQRLVLSTQNGNSVNVGVEEEDDDPDLVEEDHQTLNNQVNQYFQHIKHYANSTHGEDDDSDDENEVDDADMELDEEDEDEDDEDANFVNHSVSVAVGDVDFGDVDVDLDLNIDKELSESLANYNAKQAHNNSTNNSASNRNVHDDIESQINSSKHTSSAIKDDNSNRISNNNYDLVGTGVVLKTSVISNQNLKRQLKSQIASNEKNQANKQPQQQLTVPISTVQKNIKAESLDTSKRECQFCGKTFQHAGSLGRHLDNQKGNELHPLKEVEKLRSNVARRGDPEAIKARRLQRSKEYNRREYVKEKNRLRRKYTSKLSRVKESYQMKFYRQINHPTLPTHPSFPRMVLFFLPPNAWPHDPPTAQTFKTLVLWLESNQDVQIKIPHLNKNSTLQNHLEKLTIGFENWQTLSTEDKKDMWIREQRTVFQELLGDLSIFDFAIRDNWAKHLMEEKKAEIGIQKEIYSDNLLSESNASRTDINSDHGQNQNINHHILNGNVNYEDNKYSNINSDSNNKSNYNNSILNSQNNSNKQHSQDQLENLNDYNVTHNINRPLNNDNNSNSNNNRSANNIGVEHAQELNNIGQMHNISLEDMPGLGENGEENDVKLEEADLAVVAAAAAAAAVRDDDGFPP